MKRNGTIARFTMATSACLLVAGAAAIGAEGKSEANNLLAMVDQQLVSRYEAALRAGLDGLAAGRVGPVVLTEERFTKKLPDGSVQVSQYWGRAPMQAYPFFDAGSVELSPEEFERAKSSAAAWVANQNGPPKSPVEFLMKLRTAQGKFTPDQLAAGGPPHFCGTGLHSFKVANWFDIPWR